MLSAATVSTQEFFTTLSFDVVVIATLIAFFFVLGLRSGKTKLIGIVFSSYVATLLLTAFPYRDSISFDVGLLFDKYSIVDLGLLILLVALIQIILDYVLELEFEGFSIRKTVESLVLSASTALSFLSAMYLTNVVQNKDIEASFLDAIFASEQYLFLLLLAPLVGVFLIAR